MPMTEDIAPTCITAGTIMDNLVIRVNFNERMAKSLPPVINIHPFIGNRAVSPDLCFSQIRG